MRANSLLNCLGFVSCLDLKLTLGNFIIYIRPSIYVYITFQWICYGLFVCLFIALGSADYIEDHSPHLYVRPKIKSIPNGNIEGISIAGHFTNKGTPCRGRWGYYSNLSNPRFKKIKNKIQMQLQNSNKNIHRKCLNC